MLPKDWQKKVIDLNVNSLLPKVILWADYVFINAMSIQRESVNKIIECKKYNAKIVAGGPYSLPNTINTGVDHLVLNETEVTLPQFPDDLKQDILKKYIPLPKDIRAHELIKIR
jgi:hypothetical protein